MSLQYYAYLLRREPQWFTRVRRVFGDLIYDTSVKELGIDTKISYSVIRSEIDQVILDVISRCYVRWKE